MTSSKNGGHFDFFSWLNLNLLSHWTSMQSFIEISLVVRELGMGGNFTPPPPQNETLKSPPRLGLNWLIRVLTHLTDVNSVNIKLQWFHFPTCFEYLTSNFLFSQKNLKTFSEKVYRWNRALRQFHYTTGFTSFRPGFRWFHLVSSRFKWFHLVSCGFAWFHLVTAFSKYDNSI